MITLLFSRRRHIGSYGIRLITWSPWSHVDMFTQDGTLIGALASEGVKEYSILHRVEQSEAFAVCQIEGDEVAAVAYARSQLGKPYDWLGLIGVISPNRDWQEDDKWFCSELIAKAAIMAGNQAIKRDVARIDPGELYRYTVPVYSAK